MKNIPLNEELLNQLRLIKYDRSKTLLEQTGYEGRLEKQGEDDKFTQDQLQKRSEQNIKNIYQQKIEKEIKKHCDSKLSSLKTPNGIIAKDVFNTLKTSIVEKGTEEDDILNALKKIKNKEIYTLLLEILYTCYPSSTGQTIISILQNLEFSKGSFASDINKSYDLGQTIQYEFNDKWLEAYQNILQKFNKDEIYDVEFPSWDDNKIQQAYKESFPPFVRKVAHLTLPLVSFALMLIPGGQGASGTIITNMLRWTSFGLEAIDASIYKFADKDDYLAGLTLIFAFLAPLEIAFAKYGPGILRKISQKNFQFTDDEIKVLADLATNSNKYNQMAKSQMVNAWLENTVKIWVKGVNQSNFLVIFAKLTNIAKSLGKNLAELTLQIGGATFTWDYIASKLLGIKCRTFDFGELLSLLNESLKEYGELAQPFTIKESDGCDEKMKKILYNERLKQMTNEDYNISNPKNYFYYKTFDYLIKNKTILSDKLSNTYSNQVSALQNVLSSLGYEKLNTSVKIENNTFYIDNNDIYKKVKIFNTTGSLIKEINISNKTSHSEKINVSDNKIFIVALYYTDKDKTLVKIFNKNNYNVTNININCGIFDVITKQLVISYQKKNNLTSDGIVGENTFKLLMKQINSFNKTIIERCKTDKTFINNKINKDVVETVKLNEELANKLSDEELLKYASESFRTESNKTIDILKSQKEYTQEQLDSLKLALSNYEVK